MRASDGRCGSAGWLGLLAWGWLLLVFAAQSPANVIGALWLMAGLPAMRNGYRRRLLAWGVDGIQTDRPDILAGVLVEEVGRPAPPGLRRP